MQNFDIKLDIFTDVSDDLLKNSDRVLKEAQSDNISDILKSYEKGSHCFAEPISDVKCENISKSRFARKTESKSRWVVNLFNSWLENRQDNYGNRNDIRKIQTDLLTMDHETPNYLLGAFITEVRKENDQEYRGNTLYEINIAIQHYLCKIKGIGH